MEVHALEARVGGVLHYDMIADTPEMIETMRRMGRPSSHGTRGKFVEFKPNERLAITHMIDFLPGVKPYASTLLVEFFPSGESVHMVITLDPMHDEQFTKMSTMGMTSQLTKLDKRFEKPSALPGVAVARASYQAYVDKDRQSQRCAALLLSKRRLIGSSHSGIRPWRSSSVTCLIERSMAGLTAARAEGRTGGNRRKTTPAGHRGSPPPHDRGQAQGPGSRQVHGVSERSL